MEEIEEIYQKIINKTDKNLTKKEFGDLIEEKIGELGGLCDKETAAKLIARDFDINPEEKFLKVNEIDEEMERASFVAKVIDSREINTFEREDGSVGRVANLTLADDTGEIKVVLWDEDADLVKLGEIEEGDVLRIRRGKVKSGYSGPEVNLSNVSDVTKEEDPGFEVKVNEKTPISDLEEDMGSVNIFAEVIDVGDLREFENENGEGKVRSIKLGDETGKIRASLWGKHAELELEEGDRLRIEHAYTRERYGEVELNVGYRGKTEIKENGVSYKQKITSLSEVSEGKKFDVKGRVTGVQDIHYFEKKDGSEGKVSNIYLKDDSDERRVALWGEKADFVEKLEPGDTVFIEDARATSNNDRVELSVGWSSSIEKISEEKEEVESISEISGGERVKVVGTVIDDDIIDDGEGSVWVRGNLPEIGKRVKVIGESFVENNRVFVELSEFEVISYSENEIKDIAENLLKQIGEK